MTLLKVCPSCLRNYRDLTLNFCTDDGTELSEAFTIPLKDEGSEVETVIRQRRNIEPATQVHNENVKQRANAKSFIARNFPELSKCKRRTSRMWEHSERPEYHDNWWFGIMDSDLNNHEYIVFAGALDYENKNFKILKVPTAYLRDNLSNLDVTDDGWINLYIHMRELNDVRNPARLSFRQFVLN